MTDIEIARSTKLEKIVDVAKKIGIEEDDLEQYGKFKAKISNEVYEKLTKAVDGLDISAGVCLGAAALSSAVVFGHKLGK